MSVMREPSVYDQKETVTTSLKSLETLFKLKDTNQFQCKTWLFLLCTLYPFHSTGYHNFTPKYHIFPTDLGSTGLRRLMHV